MEETAQAQPVAQPTPQVAPQATSSINANQLIVKFLEMAIAGFAIGMGFILAQKALNKKITVVEKSTVSNAQGPMYPPRRPMPRGPMIPRQNPYAQPYMQANGQERFDLESWMNSGTKELDIDWNNVID